VSVSVTLKLFSCAIVVGLWAVVTAAGVHSSLVDAAFLVALAVALVVSELELMRQRRRRG
jgi:hypothetical protein